MHSTRYSHTHQNEHTHTHTHIPWLTGPSCCGRPHGCLVRCHCARTDLLDGCDTIHFVVIVIADVVVVLSCSPCLSPATPGHVLTYVSFFLSSSVVGWFRFFHSFLSHVSGSSCCSLSRPCGKSEPFHTDPLECDCEQSGWKHTCMGKCWHHCHYCALYRCVVKMVRWHGQKERQSEMQP